MHREVKKGLYDKSAIALETKELSVTEGQRNM